MYIYLVLFRGGYRIFNKVVKILSVGPKLSAWPARITGHGSRGQIFKCIIFVIQCNILEALIWKKFNFSANITTYFTDLKLF